MNETPHLEDTINRLHLGDEQLRDRLLLALPKKGRLYESCITLLERCGIKYRKKARLDLALCTSLNMALIFLPAADIALYVSQGRIDMGITGQDVIAEQGGDVNELLQLEFGKCKLCVQVPVESKISGTKDLVGKRIVTSFPNLTRNFLKSVDPEERTKINYVNGSVEVACSLGVADAIVDLVETGDTMRASGLDVLTDVMQSQAVLIANPKSPFQKLIKTMRSRMEGVIHANESICKCRASSIYVSAFEITGAQREYVMVEYNVERKDLAEAMKITPGKKSPTLAPLDDQKWITVKALVPRTQENSILDKLQAIGAEDILTFYMQNCRV